MSKMKDVYVIKVKTKSPLSSLYPSERRYSASTVGGLSLVHLGLSILAFLLGILARSLQGPVLSFACIVPFVSGLLAWRRWYIDKNISFFFYGSLFSLVVSILCGVATVFDVAVLNESEIITPGWKIDNIFSYPERFDNDKRFVRIIDQNDTEEGFIKVLEGQMEQDNNCNDTFNEKNDFQENVNRTEEITDLKSTPENMEQFSSSPLKYINGFTNGIFSFWRRNPSAEKQTNIILDINVLVTCLLEIFWSLLSVKISLRGMRNQVPETRYDGNSGSRTQRIQPRPSSYSAAEEQLYSRDDIYDENVNNFGYRRNSINQNSGPRLPLPESNKEFRERVERFLANQAAHRIVEGSCS